MNADQVQELSIALSGLYDNKILQAKEIAEVLLIRCKSELLRYNAKAVESLQKDRLYWLEVAEADLLQN